MARRKQPADLAARADEAVGALAYGGFATGDMEELRVLLADVADREALAEALIEAAARSPFWMLDPVEMSQFAAFLVLTVGEKAAAGGFDPTMALIEAVRRALEENRPERDVSQLVAALRACSSMRHPPRSADKEAFLRGRGIDPREAFPLRKS